MVGPVADFALEHLVVLIAGAVSLLGGLALRSYGRRLERQTLARGRQLSERT